MRLTGLVVFLLALFSPAVSAQDGFAIWVADLKQEAGAAGISDATVNEAFNHIELLPELIKLDHAQPEFISPFLEYYYRRIDVQKIARGRELMIQHAALLDKIEAQYGVPKSLLVAFWGMETNYGKNQGNIDTLSALATLAYDGRRAAFFRNQFLDALQMVDAGCANVGSLRGSWAGAFGNMQFMPSTFVTFAVDGDGDHQIDVVNSVADAFTSAANYLSQVGWNKDEPAMIEVHLPDDFEWQNAQMNLRKPVADWVKLGVDVVNSAVESNAHDLRALQDTKKAAVVKKGQKHQRGSSGSKKNIATSKSARSTLIVTAPSMAHARTTLANMKGQAAILLPQGQLGPAFMVFDNFDAIMDWNRSVNYALSVAQFAKRINQESRIVGGEHAEAGALSFQQMFELQNMLNSLGFEAGEPDGFPGLQTQQAIRAYQLSQHLAADGYASPSLFNAISNALPEQLTR